MPWNLHLCVTRASTAMNAEGAVWWAVCDNTDPDTAVEVCGSVSEKSEVHLVEDETGYLPSHVEELSTIAQINEWLGSMIRPDSCPETEILETLRQIASGQEVTDDHLLWRAERYLHGLVQEALARAARPAPDVFKQEFYAWEFREEGITHIGDLNDPQLGERFVVILKISN